MSQKHCSDPQNHEPKYTFLCFSCASQEKVNYQLILFCSKCSKQHYKQHKDHRDFNSIQSKFFKQRLEKFQKHLKNQASKFQLNSNPFTNAIINNEKLNFGDLDFKRWLIETQFWKLFNHVTQLQAFEKITKSLLKIMKESSFSVNNSGGEDSAKLVKLESIVNWDKFSDENGASILNKMCEQAASQKQRLLKQKFVIDILIEAYSCSQEKSKEVMIGKINKAIEKFPRECSLLMMKLYLMELHQENIQEWQPLLKLIIQIQPSMKNSPFSFFIQSHKYWIKLDKEKLQRNQSDTLFMDIQSGNIYKLAFPQQYVNLLNTQIISNSNNFILNVAKSLGLLAQKKYPQALKTFQRVSQNSSQESLIMSQFYAQVNNKTLEEEQDVQNLLNELQNKSKSYIINAIRYFKKKGLHEKIIFCHETLQHQKNDTIFSKVQYINSLLKLEEIQQAKSAFNGITADKINLKARERLIRKIKYAEARIFAADKLFDDSTNQYHILVRQKRSASACYSLASAFYNEQKWEEAQKYIDEALSMKQSDKYKKLKLYILIMKKDLSSAKQLFFTISEGVIDQKIRQMLSEHN